MRRLILTLTVLTACRASAPSESARQGITEVVVANQQSASASLMSEDGLSMKHIPVGTGPHEAMVSPDGRVAVVTIYGTQTPGNQLAVIDLVRDSVIRTIDLGAYRRPHGVLFLAGSSDRVAVTSEASRNLLLVTLSTGTIDTIPTNARGSHMVAVERTGARAWTANIGDNNVSELDLVAKMFVRAIAVPSRPEGITVTPDGAEVWVGSNDTGAVSVIDTRSGQVAHTLTGATFPYRLGSSPDGSRIAVVDGQGNRLMIADVASHAWLGSIPLASPRGVIIAGDNRTAYVTLAAGELAVVDIVELEVLRKLAVQTSPDGVGVGLRR